MLNSRGTLNNYGSEFQPQLIDNVYGNQIDDQYYEGNDYANEIGTGEWFALRSVTDSPINSITSTPSTLTSLSFDPWEELIWSGLSDGRVVSYLSNDMVKYTAFRAHENEVRQIAVDQDGIVSMSTDNLRYYTRGGLLQLSFSNERMQNLNTFAFLDNNNTQLQLLLGGENSLIIFDLFNGRVVREVDWTVGANVIKRGRVVWCANANGKVTMHDPRTLRTENTLDAHTGEVTDMDIKGDVLVTCGISHRANQYYVDSLVRVFDIRTLRALTPFSFPQGPSFLKFHPTFSSTVVMASMSGVFQLCDILGDPATFNMQYQVDIAGHPLTTFDICSTGEIIAFGDGGGFVHQWADRPDIRVNVYSMPTELPTDDHPTPPPKIVDENDSLSFVTIPTGSSEPLLSDWPHNLTFPVAAPPTPIDERLLTNLKQIDFVGYIANPGITRRQLYTRVNHPTRIPTDPTRSHAHPNSHQRQNPGAKKSVLLGFPLVQYTPPRPPKPYRYVEIKYSKLGLEEFDFSRYNRTIFSGLENALPNSYCNAIIQVLFFQPHIRSVLRAHLCEREFCLACEMGFLFHMLNLAGPRGSNVQASNFLRAFRQMPQASALGLLQAPESPETPLPLLAENFNRFLLENLHKELSSSTLPHPQNQTAKSQPQSTEDNSVNSNNNSNNNNNNNNNNYNNNSNGTAIIENLFSTTIVTHTRCLNCGYHSERFSKCFQHDIVYDTLNVGKNPNTSFSSVLKNSICRESQTKTWCEKCTSYQAAIQKKTPTSLPHILCLNAGLGKSLLKDMPAIFSEFWKNSTKEGEDGDLGNYPWLPSTIRVSIDNQRNVTVTQDGSENEESENPQNIVAVYKITAIISHVHDPSKKAPKSGHLVTHALIPHQIDSTDQFKQNQFSTSPINSPRRPSNQWVLFNDFRVSHSSLFEAINFDKAWRTPCVLYFSKVDLEQQITVPIYPSPITEDVFFSTNPYGRDPRTRNYGFVALQRGQLPGKNDTVAIDAEFVSLGAEETEIRSDGTRVIVNPAHFSLARVSVLHGKKLGEEESELTGCPFVDDFIVTPDPITDYLTRYSGILPGDLDPITSTKHITSLKAVYLRLRLLIDSGVRFIGHGLKKDFRIINVYVPPEQIIDTVELYSIQRQRKISLRFLAALLLNLDIQTETHDSIEDARTALMLYEKYLELKNSGSFDEMLQHIYHIGRMHNWKLELDQISNLHAEFSQLIHQKPQGDNETEYYYETENPDEKEEIDLSQRVFSG